MSQDEMIMRGYYPGLEMLATDCGEYILRLHDVMAGIEKTFGENIWWLMYILTGGTFCGNVVTHCLTLYRFGIAVLSRKYVLL